MAKPKPASLSRTIGAKPYSMIELKQMVLESRRKAKLRAKRLPLATAVECDPKTGVSITMEDGCRVFIPLSEFHELRGATHSELRDVGRRDSKKIEMFFIGG